MYTYISQQFNQCCTINAYDIYNTYKSESELLNMKSTNLYSTNIIGQVKLTS